MRDEQNKDGRVPSEAGSRASAEPQSTQGLGPTGFDPSRIAEQIEEGGGFWRTCSGCHESEDGYDIGSYPWSPVFQCKLGAGCGECGGLGATWDYTDWSDFADWSIRRDRTRENIISEMNSRLIISNGAILGFAAAADAIMALDYCDSDGSPKGGDACGSAHDSAGLQGIAQTLSDEPSNPEKLSVVERVTDALAVAAGTPGFGSDMGVWSELASTVLEAASEILSLQERLDKLTEALRLVRARTYSSDRGCALGDQSVAEICDIATSALSRQTREGDK